MTIELDSTLAQAEVLFLSFAQTVADMDRRQAEENFTSAGTARRRIITNSTGGTEAGNNERRVATKRDSLSDDLRSLLVAGR